MEQEANGFMQVLEKFIASLLVWHFLFNVPFYSSYVKFSLSKEET